MRARSHGALALLAASALGCSLVESFDGYTGGASSDATIDDSGDTLVGIDAPETTNDTSPATDAPTDMTPPPTDAPIDTTPPSDTPIDTTPPPCPGTKCGAECVSLDDDPRHCGSCGYACPYAGDVCIAGSCVCGSGLTACGTSEGPCFDLEGDAQHCTACTTSCVDNNTCRGLHHELSGYFCVLNTYGCPSATTACPSDRGDFSCFDTTRDPKNCGGCGVVCAIDQLCVSSKCRTVRPAVGCTSAPCTCPAGYADCSKLVGGTDRLCVDGGVCP